MKIRRVLVNCVLVSSLFVTASFAADDGLVGWWKFDDKSETITLDSISRMRDEIDGNFKYVSGRQIRRGKDFRFGHTPGL